MKITLFCKCGAGAEGDLEGPGAAEKFRSVWYTLHTGEGHGDCRKAEAQAAFWMATETGGSCG